MNISVSRLSMETHIQSLRALCYCEKGRVSINSGGGNESDPQTGSPRALFWILISFATISSYISPVPLTFLILGILICWASWQLLLIGDLICQKSLIDANS